MTDTDIRIGPIDVEHLDAAWALWLRALHEHPEAFGQLHREVASLGPDEVRAIFESSWNYRDNRVFGAITGAGEVVGMTGIARLYREKMRHRAELWGVYILPGYRGLGLSTRLFDTAVAYCRDEIGVLQLHLEVISTNAPAVRSYERAGFVRYGRIPRADIVDGSALDCDLMVLMLDGYPATG